MKIRRVDVNHEEFLAAVSGEMTPAELGVYWMICLLQYNRGGGYIKYDMVWLRQKFTASPGNHAIKGIVDNLIKSGRVERVDNEIGVRRCRAEIERKASIIQAAIENGARGGRPCKEINGLEKGSGFCDEKLTTTTTVIEEKKVSPNGETKEKRATRLPTDFKMPDEWIQAGVLARERHQLPALDYDLEAERFCSYWWSKGGSQGRKTDWQKTWTNWCLNAHGGVNGQRRQSPINSLWEGAARAAAAFEARDRDDYPPAEPFLDSR